MALNPLVDSRDVRFILFELLEIEKLNKLGRYSEFDRETYEDVINLVEAISINKVYPANTAADKEHAQFNPATGEVKIPHAFKESLDAYYEAGLLSLPFEESDGGMGMPVVLKNTVSDYFSAASMALGMFPMLSSGALNMYINFLPEGERKKSVIEKMISGEWGGSMCLTEPDAGSDVGALKTKAVKNDDGTYSITGQKIFISNGDNDYYANNVHPVLARIEGDPAGTKGISIFMVPKYWINEDGSPGEHNDIICSGIEEKMGIHGNPTCTLNFGDNGKCRGILMGEEKQGMKIMFQMMNDARLFVGCQGMSLSSTAYLHAVKYAKNRIQGKHVTQMLNPEAKSVAISQHPDVKRMLLSMKSKVEAMRTLVYFCGILIDYEIAAEEKKKEEAAALLEFLTPITKAGNTDLAWDVTGTAVQVYGGYGYCADYPVEQFARDSKILSIYEGTNGIQALDLVMRKLLMNENLRNYSIYKKRIEKVIEDAKGIVGDIYISHVQRGVEKIDEIVKIMKTLMAEGNFLHIFSFATPLRQAFSYLTYAWMHLWGLTVAIPKMKDLVGDRKGEERKNFLNDNREAAFYSGRVLSGQYYLNSEFHKFFGIAAELIAGETAVNKVSDALFSGAPEE